MNVHKMLGLMTACAVSGCSDGSGPSAETLFNQDVALFAAEGAAQDVELMRGPGGRFAFGLGADPGSFECGTAERGAMTVNRACTYFDADGNVQDSYDPATTASVSVIATVTGTLDRLQWGGTVDRESEFVVSGLAADEASMIWNGSGSGTMARIRQLRDGGEAQFDLAATHTVTDLEIPVPRTDDGWPLGGTISSSVVVTITGGPMDGTGRERDVTVAFDGTQFAVVTVNGETFTIDLANRRQRERPGPGPRGRGPARR